MAEISQSTIQKMFAQLQEANQKLQICKRNHQTQHPKIQKIAHHLRDRKHFAKHYFPKLVSIGPIHHGEKHLQLGEEYKLMWTAMYLERTKQKAEILHGKIADNIEELKDQFNKDVLLTKDEIQRIYDNEELSWMLFVDGCSLLQILEKANLVHPKEMNVKVDQLVLVLQDVLLLENQLPFQVLKLLSGDENENKLVKTMNKFFHCHHLSPGETKRDVNGDMGKRKHKDQDPIKEGEPPQEHKLEVEVSVSPTHLLDHLRRFILPETHPVEPQNVDQEQKATEENRDWCEDNKAMQENIDVITYRNIQELKAAGIGVKKSKSRCLRDISFSSGLLSGQLKLPKIIVDDTTAPTFLNLIAYEMCPGFENDYEICSFVAFLDSLIDHPDDVKELRSAGVLHNALGSDEEVAKLFNTISTELVPDTEKYAKIRAEIEKHYTNRCKTWIADGCHTYFKNPWAIIAFIATVLALVLTFTQTWFAIYPAR